VRSAIEPHVEDDDDREYGWKVLVVCTANVSRSPLAMAALRRHLRAAGIPAIVRSAGTMATELAVDERMVEAGYEIGVDISEHRPRRLTRQLMDDEGRDLIIGLSREHLREIVAHDDDAWRRTFTLKEIVRRSEGHRRGLADDPEGWSDVLCDDRDMRQLLGDDPTDDVKDPYRKSLELHREVAAEINGLCRRTVATLFELITP
jgi:protein-tyrosine phosphatase